MVIMYIALETVNISTRLLDTLTMSHGVWLTLSELTCECFILVSGNNYVTVKLAILEEVPSQIDEFAALNRPYWKSNSEKAVILFNS